MCIDRALVVSPIGERAPSSEFEAYAIQAIAQGLMSAYEKHKRKSKSRKRQ
jgi:hypothetical protein